MALQKKHLVGARLYDAEFLVLKTVMARENFGTMSETLRTVIRRFGESRGILDDNEMK